MSLEVEIERLRKELGETRAVMKDLLEERLPKVYVLTRKDGRMAVFATFDLAKERARIDIVTSGAMIVDANGLGPERHDSGGRQLPERPGLALAEFIVWRERSTSCWFLTFSREPRDARVLNNYQFVIYGLDVTASAEPSSGSG